MTQINKSLTRVKGMKIRTFGKGGQQYMADLWTGCPISASYTSTERDLFSFSETDAQSVTPFLPSLLTNLVESRRIGSTMSFKATKLTFRLVKVDSTACTIDEIQAAKTLLASARVDIQVGSNNTTIGQFSGLHLINAIEAVGSNATATAAATQGVQNAQGWISLPMPIPLQANVNIGGKLKFNLPSIPAALVATGVQWAFIVMLSGVKEVKS
jgi:hypothetical protein